MSKDLSKSVKAESGNVPAHIAIIMDGNGRWAKQRLLPRFTDTYWPDFDGKSLDEAIASFQKRERRFGRTSEQLLESSE